MRTGDRIQREIRKRAFDRRDSLARQADRAQRTQATIDALEQVTGLSRSELERIAGEVAVSFKPDKDDFFSVRRQLILTGFTVIPLLIAIWLMMLWIR